MFGEQIKSIRKQGFVTWGYLGSPQETRQWLTVLMSIRPYINSWTMPTPFLFPSSKLEEDFHDPFASQLAQRTFAINPLDGCCIHLGYTQVPTRHNTYAFLETQQTTHSLTKSSASAAWSSLSCLLLEFWSSCHSLLVSPDPVSLSSSRTCEWERSPTCNYYFFWICLRKLSNKLGQSTCKLSASHPSSYQWMYVRPDPVSPSNARSWGWERSPMCMLCFILIVIRYSSKSFGPISSSALRTSSCHQL